MSEDMGAQPFLIEVSSEAGRKIGGIYTVVSSKAREVRRHFGERYLLIGFYDASCAHEVKFEAAPKELEAVFAQLAEMGIFCHWGHWTAADNAQIILVDARGFGERPASYEEGGAAHHDRQVNYIKFLLWKHYGVDSLMDQSWDFSENVVWGGAVGLLLENLLKIKPYSQSRVIGQFHEWICAAALLYAHFRQLPMALVFTTHATVLGRSLAGSGSDLLAKAASSKHGIDVSESYRLKVEGKHLLETAAAKKADIFTTVSDSVGAEVRYVLGREPDVITLNGLDFEHMESEAKVRDLGHYMRREILQLAESSLTPYYSARHDNALLLFTSGRYEFSNKGFDIFIQALGLLNERIKKKGMRNQRQILAFVCAPSSVRGPRLAAIQNYLLLDKMQEVLHAAHINGQETYPNIAARIAKAHGSLETDLQTMASGFIKEGERPPVSFYELNYGHDPVLAACESANLRNKAEDAVKVFFYPTYIRPNDGLMNMSYYDFISGMDVGVFPSRYEPFGYTPLEAGLKMDISVSTDSAGFGRYLEAKASLEGRGVKILHMGAGSARAAQELEEFLQHLYYSDEKTLARYKEDSYQLMKLFDWKELIGNYLRAYEMAVEKRFGEKIKIDGHGEKEKQEIEEKVLSANPSISRTQKKRAKRVKK